MLKSDRPLGAAALSFALCMALSAGAGPAQAESAAAALTPELETARAALDKYRDPLVAVRDGYFSTVGCVHYAEGGMGVHFLNPALLGPEVDPMKPQILVYEPEGDKLTLVAAEWFVPLATGVEARPELFGQPFDGPMEGHEPLIPGEVHHYDLHVWLWKENPAGVFNVVNPGVSCDDETGYNLLEKPPEGVPHR